MSRCNLLKYFFASSLLIFFFLIFYTLITLNTCFYGNLKKILKKYGKDSTYANSLSSWHYIREPNIYDSETVVKVVPLSWQHELEFGENNTYGSPKYRFLQQQGLIPSKKLPDALIIGVKKGGTRALLEFLRLHPDVRAAGSEVHFFDKHYWKGFQWYRHCMPATLEGQVTLEKTPSYFITKEVPKRVYKMNPAARLVVVVRDPVTRAVSDYTQAISKKVTLKSFEEMAFPNGTDGVVNTSWGPVKIGVYARHLERWIHYFPLSQFLFVSGERLIIDPAAEMARVQEFLGLKQIITEKYFYFNSTKGFPCLLKSEGHPNPHCLGKTKGRSHPFVDIIALQRLRNFYRPFNEKFYEMTGINFGWP